MSEMSNPYIFPECEGCEDHRYTYGHKTINVITGVGGDGKEIIAKVKVEPETHYCVPEVAYYVKLKSDYRPLHSQTS